MTEPSHSQGPAFLSYGFRPFFFLAALFAGLAIPVWVLIVTGMDDTTFLYPAREWHVHEMVFGFLPCVITGFLLTAMPNWTDRPPMTGFPLMLLGILWLAGRAVMAIPGFSLLASALVDGAFLVVVAGIVWREISAAKAWDRLPMGALISLYAIANLVFHARVLNDVGPEVAERMGLTLIMILLALIGGRVTPSFTEDFLEQAGLPLRPAPFSRFDGLSIVLVALAGIAWIIQPQGMVTGFMFIGAGSLHVIRLMRWHGWMTWTEPLVLVLHIGYAWLAVALLLLGGASLGLGLQPEDAVHALTTGAVGVMTLGVMTRASLGHTGRLKHAGLLTVMIYLLVNLGAILRVFGPSLHLSGALVLGVAAVCWSGAYVLFTVGYGPMLFGPSLDED